MKRAQLQRRTPLRASSGLRTGLSRAGKRRPDPATDRAWAQARRWCAQRAGGYCEAKVEGICLVRGSHAHHIVLRSRGGPDEPHNLAWLCAPCHDYVHGHPEWATSVGLMASASPGRWN